MKKSTPVQDRRLCNRTRPELRALKLNQKPMLAEAPPIYVAPMAFSKTARAANPQVMNKKLPAIPASNGRFVICVAVTVGSRRKISDDDEYIPRLGYTDVQKNVAINPAMQDPAIHI
ncbi:hypothetical protein EO087_14795 [Dyella sp. M7H15-1]|nr:hypothetical protein EO087_14795 [Dyella sp. M7H15-1]